MAELTCEEHKEAEISIQVSSVFFLLKQTYKFAAKVIKHSWAELCVSSKKSGGLLKDGKKQIF